MKMLSIVIVIGMILAVAGIKSGDSGTGMLGFSLAIFGGCAFLVALFNKLKNSNNTKGDGSTHVEIHHHHYDGRKK